MVLYDDAIEGKKENHQGKRVKEVDHLLARPYMKHMTCCFGVNRSKKTNTNTNTNTKTRQYLGLVATVLFNNIYSVILLSSAPPLLLFVVIVVAVGCVLEREEGKDEEDEEEEEPLSSLSRNPINLIRIVSVSE